MVWEQIVCTAAIPICSGIGMAILSIYDLFSDEKIPWKLITFVTD